MNTPRTREALALLDQFVLAATLAKYDLLDAPETMTLAGPTHADVLALAGSSPDDLLTHVGYGDVHVLPGDLHRLTGFTRKEEQP